MKKLPVTLTLLLLLLCVAAAGCQPRGGAKQSALTADDKGSNCAWVREGQSVTFRAEVMPGREAAKRSFRVTKVMPSCRVLLDGLGGEHTQAEFEPVR
jgi:hypothetical protein